jgi:hypothetical protein
MNTKSYFLSLVLFVSLVSNAQLKAKVRCDDFTVDILNGKVNDIKADFTLETIKAKFPCYTTAEREDTSSKCGGGVFYKDRDLLFYTGRDYIQIGDKFKGKLSLPIMGASRNSFFKTLGNPKIKDDTWDAFQMQYGTMVLHYNKANKVIKIQISTLSTDVLNLCE